MKFLSITAETPKSDYFAEKVGIERERLSAIGWGEYKPLYPEADDSSFSARANNRRVEIKVKYDASGEQVAPDSVRKLIDVGGLGIEEPKSK